MMDRSRMRRLAGWLIAGSALALVGPAIIVAWRVSGMTLQHTVERSIEEVRGADANVDMFCGPRCVQMILRFYGKEEELLPLISEIQDRDWENGSDLPALERALRKRGIHTTVVDAGGLTRISWHGPTVLHLPASSSIGHFVVQLPTPSFSSRFIATVWCGLSGNKSITHWRLGFYRSPVAMLTSDAPISNGRSALRDVFGIGVYGFAVAWLLLLLVASRRLRLFFSCISNTLFRRSYAK